MESHTRYLISGFFMSQFPLHLWVSYSGPFQNFIKIRRDIRNFAFI